MTETVRKKGLSKGCIVGLIVAGVVALLALAIVAFIFFKGGEMTTWALVKSVENEKRIIMSTPIQGVDTVVVNRVADAFIERLQSQDIDLQGLQPYGEFVRSMATDEKIDSTEAAAFVEAMIACYPELAELKGDAISDEAKPAPDSSEDDMD